MRQLGNIISDCLSELPFSWRLSASKAYKERFEIFFLKRKMILSDNGQNLKIITGKQIPGQLKGIPPLLSGRGGLSFFESESVWYETTAGELIAKGRDQ